jgi:hypothetical protein
MVFFAKRDQVTPFFATEVLIRSVMDMDVVRCTPLLADNANGFVFIPESKTYPLPMGGLEVLLITTIHVLMVP